MNEDDRKLLFGLIVFTFVFTLLPIIAPVAAHLGLDFVADPIYWIYQWVCHQRPWRSYHLFDYQLAMDARMMLMFGSFAIGGLLVYLKNIKPLKPTHATIFVVALLIPLGLDGTIQAIAEISSTPDILPFYESTNLMRSLTGILFGIGMSFGFLPFFNRYRTYSKLKAYFKPMMVTLFISLIFIAILVLSWNLTSNVYKPSHLFIDMEQRFPGYNYEITTGAGHSTIIRIAPAEDVGIYLQRADHFKKSNLLYNYKLNDDQK